jgi:NADH dehydrogenase
VIIVGGGLIADEVSDRSNSVSRAAFTFADKGSMAVIGKAKAVAQLGRFHLTGFLGWLISGGIHIAVLIGFRHRL